MITTGSMTGTGNDQDKNKDGLPYNHAFSVLKAIELNLTDGQKVKLVQLRNPWGNETYKGRWSDRDVRWTAELLAQADHNIGDDGKFFMQYEDYVEQLEYTDFNLDVSQMHHSSFVFQDDDEPVNRSTVFADDDREYNIHTLIIQSTVN